MRLRGVGRRLIALERATALRNEAAVPDARQVAMADGLVVRDHLRARLLHLAGEGPLPPPLDPELERRWRARQPPSSPASRAQLRATLRRLAAPTHEWDLGDPEAR